MRIRPALLDDRFATKTTAIDRIWIEAPDRTILQAEADDYRMLEQL